MEEFTTKIKNIKLDFSMTLEDIHRILLEQFFTFVTSDYVLNIYFIPINTKLNSWKQLEQLDSYAVFQDHNQDKKLLLMEENTLLGKIKNFTLTKNIMNALGYQEIIYTNVTTLVYQKENIILKIKDIKDVGIYIDSNLTCHQLRKLLHTYHIFCDAKEESFCLEQYLLEKMKKEKK